MQERKSREEYDEVKKNPAPFVSMGTLGCCSGFGFGSPLALAVWFPRAVCCLCTVSSSPAKKEIRKKDFPAPRFQDLICPCPRIHALFFHALSYPCLSMLCNVSSPPQRINKNTQRDLLAHLLDKSVSLQSWIHWHLVLGQLLLVYDPRRCLFVGVNNIAVFVVGGGVSVLLW